MVLQKVLKWRITLPEAEATSATYWHFSDDNAGLAQQQTRNPGGQDTCNMPSRVSMSLRTAPADKVWRT